MCLFLAPAAAAAAAGGTAAAVGTTAAAGMSMATMATYASMALTAVSAISQYADGKKAAAAQTKMIEDGYAQEQQQTLRQYAEQNAVAQEDSGLRHREALIEEGRLKAIGAESGLAGVSNDRIVADANNQSARDIATIEANRMRATESSHSQGVSRQSNANIQLAGVKHPSALGTGLQLGASLAGAYATAKTPIKAR